MAKRKTTRTQQYGCGHNKQDTSLIPPVSPLTSPTPPQPTGGAAFPDSAPKIFSLPQNLLTLLHNSLKLQPQNFGVWRRLKRIFAMLAKERKEAKEVLWEFLGLEDDAGDEVGIFAKILMLQKRFGERFSHFFGKPPPSKTSNAWLFVAVPRLLRAPNPYLRDAG
jgi:hypothetical protein